MFFPDRARARDFPLGDRKDQVAARNPLGRCMAIPRWDSQCLNERMTIKKATAGYVGGLVFDYFSDLL